MTRKYAARKWKRQLEESKKESQETEKCLNITRIEEAGRKRRCKNRRKKDDDNKMKKREGQENRRTSKYDADMS